MIRPNRATIRIARAIALLTIVVSALARWWEAPGGSVGHVPMPASGALAPVGIELALGTIGIEGSRRDARLPER